jgi:hypothetical protein
VFRFERRCNYASFGLGGAAKSTAAKLLEIYYSERSCALSPAGAKFWVAISKATLKSLSFALFRLLFLLIYFLPGLGGCVSLILCIHELPLIHLTAGWSSGLRYRLQNQRPWVRVPVVGFCDEQLHLVTSHGCLYILLSI